MERCITCKYFSGKTYLPLCSRVLLVNTQRQILPPTSKFEKGKVYEYCYTVCSNDSLCGKDGKLYEKELTLQNQIPIIKNGKVNELYKQFGY